jgi:hypothetical protein
MMIKKMYEKPFARGLEMVGGEAVLTSVSMRAPKGKNTSVGDNDYHSSSPVKGKDGKIGDSTFPSNDHSNEFDW